MKYHQAQVPIVAIEGRPVEDTTINGFTLSKMLSFVLPTIYDNLVIFSLLHILAHKLL